MPTEGSEHAASDKARTKRLRAAVRRLFEATRDVTLDLDLRNAIELLLAAFAGKEWPKR